MTDPELYRTAIHEAGHAVAFIRLFPDRDGSHVTIDPHDGSLGAFYAEDVAFTEMSVSEADAERQFLNHAVYCCAGYAAVLAAGEPDELALRGCGQDFEQAGRFLDEGKRIAVALMAQPKNVTTVKFLADELMRWKTIPWEHAEVAVGVGDGECTMEEYRQYLSMLELFSV